MIVVVLFPIQPDLDLENHIYHGLQIWCVGLFVLLTLTWPGRERHRGRMSDSDLDFIACTAFSSQQVHPPQRSTTQHFVWSGNNIYIIYALLYSYTILFIHRPLIAHPLHNIVQYLEATQNTAVVSNAYQYNLCGPVNTGQNGTAQENNFNITLHNFLAKHPYCKLLKSVNVREVCQ